MSARWLLAAAIVAAAPSAAVAQTYTTDAVDDAACRLSTIAQRCVRGQVDYSAEKGRFEEFFTKCFFPRMTHTGPRDLAELGKRRDDLFRLHLWATNNQELQRDLTRMAFEAARRMFGPAYHPAVRYNAVLIIGLLDEQYASARSASPPRPLPAANSFLVNLLKAANDGDARITPPLVVGALVGLERHAQYRESLSADAIAQMTTEVLRVANREEPLPGINREVFRWIQVQSARTLAKLGTPGPDGKIHDALVKLVADGPLGIDNRSSVAALLANIDYEGANIDGQAAADTLLALARDVSADEARRAREFTELRLPTLGTTRGAYGEGGMMGRGVYGGGYGGGYGGFGQEVKYERRQLIGRITDLRAGLRKIKPLAPAETQEKIDAIVAAINVARDEAISRDAVDLDVVDKVRAMTSTIDRVVAPAAAVVEELDEEIFDAEFAEPDPDELEAPEAEEEAEEAP